MYALLLADSGVTGLMGAGTPRIYADRLPQNTTMPAMVYQHVSGVELTPIDATAGYQVMRSRIQVSALGKKKSDVLAILEAVRKACNYKSGVIATYTVLAVQRELVGPAEHDFETGLYMQSVDFIVTHYET